MMGEEGRTMKRRRHTPEQVIRKLREADRMLAEGRSVGEVCRYLEVSEPTYESDGFAWPQRDGLKWPRLALVDVFLWRMPEGRGERRAESSPVGR
jgi:hypothetical protein